MKTKTSKEEKKIKNLEMLIERRKREIANANKYWQDEVARIEKKQKMTYLQIELIKEGKWPL